MKRPAYTKAVTAVFLLLSGIVASCRPSAPSSAVGQPPDSGSRRVASKTGQGPEAHKIPVHERAARLYLAVITEDFATVRNLSRDRAVMGVPVAGDWPLFAAARLGRPDIMDALLYAGADPRVRNALGETLLHAAAWGGDVRCMAIALKAGITPGARDRWGHTPLFVALRRGRASAARMLMKAGARLQDVRDGSSGPLDAAMLSGDAKTVELVLESGVSSATGSPSPVHRAVEIGKAQVLRVLLSRGCSPGLKDRWLDTPLHVAASSGNATAAALLVRAGADVNARGSDGMTPLFRSCAELHPEVAKVLLGAGADPGIPTEQGGTALRIVLQMGADAWWRQQDREQPVSGDPVERTVRVLLEHGAIPQARDLVLAAHQGLPFDLLRRMYDPQYVRTGAISAALDAVLTRGCTYLEEMPDTVERALEKEKLLLDLAVSCYRAGNSPDVVDRVLNTSVTHATRAGATWWLEWAVRASDATLVRVLSRHVRPDRMLDSPAEKTLLHVAARFSSGRVVTLLLRAGARRDAADAAQRTALHTAAAYGNTDALSVLLRSGLLSLLDRTDDRGMTALMYAAHGGHTDAVRILLRAGARTDVRDRSGLTALDHALMQGKTAAVMELVKADPSMKSGRHGTTSTPVWLVLNPDQTPPLKWGVWYNMLKSLNKIAASRRRFSDSLALWDAGAMMAAGDPWSRVASVVLSSLPASRRQKAAGRAAERMTWLGHESVAMRLIEAGGDATGAARAAVFLEHTDLVKRLQSFRLTTASLLRAAVLAGRCSLLDTLISSTDDLSTAFMAAVRAGNHETVSCLIRRGADPNRREGTIRPLTVAALSGDMKMMNILLEAGALPVVRGPGSPLEEAALPGNAPQVERLLEATLRSMRTRPAYCRRNKARLPRILERIWMSVDSARAVSLAFRVAGVCPGRRILRAYLAASSQRIHSAAGRHGGPLVSDVPVFADVLHQMTEGVRQETVLGYLHGLEGAGIMPVTADTVKEMVLRGWSMPLRAMALEHPRRMKQILQVFRSRRFAYRGQEGLTLLHGAVLSGDPGVVSIIISLGLGSLLGTRDASGHTPLMLALEKGHLRAAAALLRAGAVWKPLDRTSPGPLHAAAWWCDAEAADEFLRLGIGPDVYDAWGQTPLHIAARRGCVAVVRKLLAAGAVLAFDRKWKTSAGVTHGGCSPAGYAAALGRRAVLELLRKKAPAHTPASAFASCM